MADPENKTHLGENFDLGDMPVSDSPVDKHVHLMSLREIFGPHVHENIETFESIFRPLYNRGQLLFHRRILSPIAPRVKVWDHIDQKERDMLMFGSNNYLGFANDPVIAEKVIQAIGKYGVGMAGPMLLNGSGALQGDLEQALARFKRKEDAVILPTGYQANLAWVSALMTPDSLLLCDEASHASLIDAVKMARRKSLRFDGADLSTLETLLKNARAEKKDRDIFVALQGVYSMSGEVADLKTAADLCDKYHARMVVDDAHGTGVMGKGRGTAEHCGVGDRVFLSMGTLSKSFAVTGGFLAGDKATINFIRFFARPYFFSAAISPMVAAAALAGLEILEKDPSRVEALLENVKYFKAGLEKAGIRYSKTGSAIIPVFPPDSKRFREISLELHRENLFVNGVEPPAVPIGGERFRVSVMATHSRAEMDTAVATFKKVFDRHPS